MHLHNADRVRKDMLGVNVVKTVPSTDNLTQWTLPSRWHVLLKCWESSMFARVSNTLSEMQFCRNAAQYYGHKHWSESQVDVWSVRLFAIISFFAFRSPLFPFSSTLITIFLKVSHGKIQSNVCLNDFEFLLFSRTRNYTVAHILSIN